MHNLFSGFKLPEDERALELIEKLEELYELSEHFDHVCGEFRRERINKNKRKALLLLCEQKPDYIELLLRDEVFFRDVVSFVDWAIETQFVDIT